MIVVGYTPRPRGRAALTAAIAEAVLRSCPLLVINVSRGDALVDPAFATPEQLAEARAELEASGVEHTVEQSVGGGGADELLAAVDRHRPQLLVIGIRHRTATGKMLFGSDAQRILLDAPCPVLAVKA